MKTSEIIKALESTNSRNDKEEIVERAFKSGNREFFIGAKFAYNKLISFGVKKVPMIEIEDGDTDDGGLSFEDFVTLCHRLRRREITGHAARDAIMAAAEDSGPIWNDFYRRVLLRDLKVKTTDSTINKVLKKIGTAEAREYSIPVFECQLAEDHKKHPKKMVGKKLIDIKLDGARMLSVIDIETKTVRMFTRNGIESEQFTHIRDSLTSMIPHLPESVVLDGEILCDTFQGLMSQFTRKDADTTDMKLGLFDIIPLKDFLKGKSKIAQRKRHEELCELQTTGLLREHCGDSVYVIPKVEVDLDTPEGLERMREFFNEALAAGFEGIMVKDPEAAYEGRKWSAWLKWKPVISVSLKVTAVEEGDADSEFAGTLGKLVCEGVDDVTDPQSGEFYSQVKIKVNCGSGFDKKTRDDWWAKPEKIVGYIVEIEADNITLNQKSTDVYSLRFPRLKGVRGTKPNEKI